MERLINSKINLPAMINRPTTTKRVSGNPEALFIGDRERIRTAGLPLRSVQRTAKNIERAGFPGFTFLF